MKRLFTGILALSMAFLCLTASSTTALASFAGVSAPGVLPITPELISMDAIIVQPAYIVEDVVNNSYTRELEEMTNIHLNMTVIPDDSYQEKLNLALNSGQYPEVILSGGFTNAQLVQYGTNEQILIPLNDLIEEHGYNIKKYWEMYPHIKDDMTAPDGNIYGIPGTDSGGGVAGHAASAIKAWVNEKWLENLNMAMPETTEEFRDMLVAFRDKDPNGNGIQDEIPLTGAANTWNADIYIWLLNAFGYYNTNLMMLGEDDVIHPVADRQGLGYIKELYDDGLIDPACFTQNDQQLSAIGNNADATIVGLVTCGHLGMLVSVQDVERASQYTCLPPLQGPNGYRGMPYGTEVRVSGAVFAITDKCKNPAAALKLADLMVDEGMTVRQRIGEKGVHWDDADPGTTAVNGQPATRKYLEYTVSSESAMRNDFWGGNICNLLAFDWKNTFQFTGDIHAPENYEAMLQIETDKLRPYAAPNAKQMPPLCMDSEDSARVTQLKTPLEDFVKTSYVEFITGKKSLDSDWDAFVKGIENMGYSEYLQLHQKAYDQRT